MHVEASAAVALPVPIVDLGRGLRDGLEMVWDTLWALVLGFTLSGAIQAFVPRRAMERHLGDHRPASVARASLYGMASSSCSYAASAVARSLFVRGADFLASMVFMFASTNLVLELGIVLAVLIGWQFVVAEFVGGVVMVVLLVAIGALWFRGRSIADARAHARRTGPGGAGPLGSGTVSGRDGWRRRVRTAGGWTDAASSAIGDLTMLRREMVVGFVVAGYLAALVPDRVWADAFVRGHGAWTVLENVVVGPLVAVVSFVCSIGNVPLAAALWHGGIGFGGVVAFIFADLVAMPLLLVYRRQYGGRMAVRMFGLFWLIMTAAGLVTQVLFEAAAIVPATRPRVVVADPFRWGWTTSLDLVAVVVLGVLVWLSRNRTRFGGGTGYARDPVCGMQVDLERSPARGESGGATVYFCSDRCRERYLAEERARVPPGAGARPDGVTRDGR